MYIYIYIYTYIYIYAYVYIYICIYNTYTYTYTSHKISRDIKLSLSNYADERAERGGAPFLSLAVRRRGLNGTEKKGTKRQHRIGNYGDDAARSSMLSCGRKPKAAARSSGSPETHELQASIDDLNSSLALQQKTQDDLVEKMVLQQSHPQGS